MFKKPSVIIAVLLSFFCFFSGAQNLAGPEFTPDPVKVKMYVPYLAVRHGGAEALEAWKSENKLLYYKELWYYTESFEVVRDHLSEGVSLEPSIIDISRFESSRKPGEAAIVILPGFRDALRLVPGNELLHKPEYIK